MRGMRSAFELMTKMTHRDIQTCNVVFALRWNAKPATTQAVAEQFKDCSEDLAASILHNCKAVGAMERENDEWRCTDLAVEALRVHFRQWDEVYGDEGTRKLLADQRGQVLGFLRDHGGERKRLSTIASTLGFPLAKVRRHLSFLEDEGKVESERGCWIAA